MSCSAMWLQSGCILQSIIHCFYFDEDRNQVEVRHRSTFPCMGLAKSIVVVTRSVIMLKARKVRHAMRGHVKRDAKALQRIRQLASSYSTLFLKLVAPPRRVAVDASACQSLPVNACACQSPPKNPSEYSTFLLKLILAPQRSIVPCFCLP
jgi:hypothetical protein